MPRCQRTFYRLRNGRTLAGSGVTRWLCPHCPDEEAYETLRAPDLLQYLDLCLAYCADRFGTPDDAARPTVLLRGLRPECVHEPQERRYDIYLQADSDPLQQRLQIGHEAFHRVCSQGRIFHWTHEMLACVTSIRLLRRNGLGDYAAHMEQVYRSEARRLSAAAMRQADLWAMPAYPPGLYGRAYVTGAALAATVGWDRLRPLARCLAPQGVPDLDAWLDGLPPDLRAAAQGALDGQEPGLPTANTEVREQKG